MPWKKMTPQLHRLSYKSQKSTQKCGGCTLRFHIALLFILLPTFAFTYVNLLVGQPRVLFMKTWGDNMNNEGSGIAVDSSGAIYATGYTRGSDLSGVFVLKFDPNGGLLWQRSWKYIGDDIGHSLAADSSGNVYVAGETCCSNNSAFLLKFNSSGDLVWQKVWIGGTVSIGFSVAVDSAGDAYVTGMVYTSSSEDVLLLKFNSAGDLLWQRSWGGSGTEYGKSVAVDSSGNAFVTGFTTSSYAGSEDVFLLKFDPTGKLLWQRTWGGDYRDEGNGVALDTWGGIYVTGSTESFPPYNVGGNLFLLKFTSSGSLIWQRTWGGNFLNGGGFGVTADPTDTFGSVYVTGWFDGTGVLLKFDSLGDLCWKVALTSSMVESFSYGVAADSLGNPVLIGAVYRRPYGNPTDYNLSLTSPSGTLGFPAFSAQIPNLAARTPNGSSENSIGTLSIPLGKIGYAGSGGVLIFKGVRTLSYFAVASILSLGTIMATASVLVQARASVRKASRHAKNLP